MDKWQRFVGVTVAVGVLLAVISLTGAGSASAQATFKPLMAFITNDLNNPVPVRVTGEAARRPYSVEVIGTCNDSNCFFDFPDVPEGMRLEIRHVSAIARPSAAATIVDLAELVTKDTEDSQGFARNVFDVTLIGQAGNNTIFNTYGFNQEILAHVGPGEGPRLEMSTRDGGSIAFSQATISGYLVAVQ